MLEPKLTKNKPLVKSVSKGERNHKNGISTLAEWLKLIKAMQGLAYTEGQNLKMIYCITGWSWKSF